MKEFEFTHRFIINPHGIPFSERENTGELDVDISESGVCLSGNKDGLLALASKIIEVANAEAPNYHKHLDEVEIPNVKVSPPGIDVNIGISKV